MSFTSTHFLKDAAEWVAAFEADFKGGYIKTESAAADLSEKLHKMFGWCYFCQDQVGNPMNTFLSVEGLPFYCRDRIKIEMMKR